MRNFVQIMRDTRNILLYNTPIGGLKRTFIASAARLTKYIKISTTLIRFIGTKLK